MCAMSMRKLRPCPACSGTKLIAVKICYPDSFPRSIGRYYIECDTCHWCGKPKRFLFRAKMSWNRRESEGVRT